jgi:mannose-1-phosphate guanylyltransferase
MPRVAVILAGGSGERFWPASTPDRPKQLLHLFSPDATLLEEAIERATPIFGKDNIFIVTGERIAPAIAESGLLPEHQILVEPTAKNTLGALIWATFKLTERGFPDETTVAILTADHAIGDSNSFQTVVQSALELAESNNGLVTIGVQPTRPETGYGYIHQGAPLGNAFKVQRFAEKPPQDVAQSYLDSGEYLWNSGMFFWRIRTFREALEKHAPEAANILERLPTDPAAFQQLSSIAVDRAIMEKADNIYVVPAQFPWDDVGSWDALARTHKADGSQNTLVGPAIQIDSHNNVAYSEGIQIAMLGVEDLIVVATQNGVLVCHKSQAQRVRELLPKINSDG